MMPKEMINSKFDATTYAQVGWSKESGHVQLGVLDPGTRLAIVERDAIRLENPEEIEGGWFIQLDRNGINRLIRTLRKARDQAYGADA